MSDDFVFIRKFKSVKDFMAKVNCLDTVLENIESFSLEPRMKMIAEISPQKIVPLTPEPGSPS